MSNAETLLYSALSGYAPLQAIVGMRVYPDEAPEGQVPPYIVFGRSGSQPTYTIHGQLIAQEVSMTVYCVALTRLQADSIGDAAIEAMRINGGHVSSQRAGVHDPDVGWDECVLNFEVWEGTAN